VHQKQIVEDVDIGKKVDSDVDDQDVVVDVG
jgi:hypothetical protein